MSFIMRLAENMDAVAWSKPNDRHYAWQYAMWAYQQAISDVLEKLRSDEGKKFEDEFNKVRTYRPFHDQWADWLERELLGDEK